MKYYDPMFFISSREMPFTIRIEATLKQNVEADRLSRAVNTAIQRYPYFAVRVAEQSGELVTVPNSLPVVVYHGRQARTLGSESVNRHLVTAAFYDNVINFYTTHVITDGAGFFPFIKTALYYYLGGESAGLSAENILLADSPFFDDELGNPYPEEKMAAASPFYEAPGGDFFRLRDGGYVTDDRPTAYLFRVREDELMQYNHDNDGSPCVLLSALMTRAIWSVHPDEHKDIVSAVSFNLRPGLGNRHSYRMLCSYIPLRYPDSMRSSEVARLCTCSRGMVTLQSQPENVLYYAQQTRQKLERLLELDAETQKKLLGKMALEDSTANTFSVSYVGKVGLGDIEPQLETMYDFTDGSTYKTAFIEIAAINGWFDIALIQGFSSDVYYRALLRQLEECGLSYKEDGASPLGTPGLELPV